MAAFQKLLITYELEIGSRNWYLFITELPLVIRADKVHAELLNIAYQ